MPSENGAPDAYNDFLRHEGCPTILRRDNSRVQSGFRFQQLNRLYLIGDEYTEPYHPQQNMAELRAVKWLKQHTQLLLDRTGAPPMLWLLASQYLAALHNHSADETLNWAIPLTLRHGDTPDISKSHTCSFMRKCIYLDYQEVYPDTKEKPGYWLGIADNVGDILTYKILTDHTQQVVLHRSVVQPCDLAQHPNHRIQFNPMNDPEVANTTPLTPPLPALKFYSTPTHVEPTISRRSQKGTWRYNTAFEGRTNTCKSKSMYGEVHSLSSSMCTMLCTWTEISCCNGIKISMGHCSVS